MEFEIGLLPAADWDLVGIGSWDWDWDWDCDWDGMYLHMLGSHTYVL